MSASTTSSAPEQAPLDPDDPLEQIHRLLLELLDDEYSGTDEEALRLVDETVNRLRVDASIAAAAKQLVDDDAADEILGENEELTIALRQMVDLLERTGSCTECGRRTARGHASGCATGQAIDTARRFL